MPTSLRRTNAERLASRRRGGGDLFVGSIPTVATSFGVDSVHLVTHSKGGLDARDYLANYQSQFDDQFEILSLTTLGGPHNGSALADLVELRAYIAEDRPQAASAVARRILDAASHLERFPEMGRPGRVAGTRELVVNRTPYLVPYRIREDTIELLRVLHGARKWPERFL